MTAALWELGLPETEAPAFIPGNLATKFLEPPFTVLDSRGGRWQERKRAWLTLGIQSELGRGADVLFDQASQDRLNELNGGGPGFAATSIFDPVLCELAYRWFAPPGGSVLDPFAGGSVRGIVAAKLGHPYTGIDLSRDQLVANRAQAATILGPGEPLPAWHAGDSARMEALLPAGEQYDMVFSCPPYFDLEVYSDDAADLSNMPWGGFMMAYDAIVEAACARLRPGRFAVFVVSEVRDPSGAYRGLVPYTIHSFTRAGMRYYNEAVLVNSAGTLPLRAAKAMEATRKLGRSHQNVLVFLKGDPPRGWSYDRVAPPSPQLDLHLLPSDVPAPPAPLAAPAALPELVVSVGADGDGGRQRATVTGAAPAGTEAWVDQALLPVEPTPVAAALAQATVELTPVQPLGRMWLKRDDLYERAGVRGGKVRTCWLLAQGAAGLVTAGSRSSPQANIVAHVANALGIPSEVHTPEGKLSPELTDAQAVGAMVIQHKAGYNSVIIARARAAAAEHGGSWREIPFGMECQEAVDATAGQVRNLPPGALRIVVPVGSGMSLAGILTGLATYEGAGLPVLGVVVGADPVKRLDKWAPADWRDHVELVPSGSDYHEPADWVSLQAPGGEAVELDAHYEAKCIPFLRAGDVLWCVGIRATQLPPEPDTDAAEQAQDAAQVGTVLEPGDGLPTVFTGTIDPAPGAKRPTGDELMQMDEAAFEEFVQASGIGTVSTLDPAAMPAEAMATPDGYLADPDTGEVLGYPTAFEAEHAAKAATVAAQHVPTHCAVHIDDFHPTQEKADACTLRPSHEAMSVVPPGGPGSGATSVPPTDTRGGYHRPAGKPASSDEQEEPHGSGAS